MLLRVVALGLAVAGCAARNAPPPSLPTVIERPAHVARAGNVELTWDELGDPRQPTVLLIMGLGLPMIAWDEAFCSSLAAHGLHVVRFDNRDVGQSTHFDAWGVPNILAVWDELVHHRRPHVPYSLDDMAADVLGLLDALHVERAHLVGVSMGGMIAQLVAAHHPERVLTLTSIMSSTGDPDVRGPSFETVLALLRPVPADRASYIERGVAVAHLLAGGRFPVDDAAVRRLAARSFDRERGGARTGGLERQLAAILTAPGRRALLASVTAPTLVIHGAADPLVPVDGGRATAAAIPGARLDVIPGMGHELPRALWAHVVDEIAALTQTR